MKVEIDIEEVASKEIESLKKTIRSLEAKLAMHDKKIVELKSNLKNVNPNIAIAVKVLEDCVERLNDLGIIESRSW